MIMADADKMLEWKNYEETRKFAIKSDLMILREDHLKWLEKNIDSMSIIEVEVTVDLERRILQAGAIRVNENEISIWIDRGFRGVGLATAAIQEVAKSNMTAKIVHGNIASMRAFVKAGFIPKWSIENYYKLQKP
jgi:hypothetical protein